MLKSINFIAAAVAANKMQQVCNSDEMCVEKYGAGSCCFAIKYDTYQTQTCAPVINGKWVHDKSYNPQTMLYTEPLTNK